MSEHSCFPQRVAWLAHSFGYGGDFMYLGPILAGYCRRFPASRIFVKREMLAHNPLGLPLAPSLKVATLTLQQPSADGSYGHVLEIPSPGFVFSLLRFRPDLLILYDFSRVTWLGALAAAALPRCRVLLLVESDPAFRGIRHRGLALAIRRLITRRATRVLTNNAAGGAYLREVLGVAEDKLSIAPYLTSTPPPVAVDAEADRRCGDDDGRVEFLFLNAITPRKGLAWLLRAVAELDPAHRGKMTLRVVGDGPQRPAMVRLVAELGIGDAVRFAGQLPYAAVGAAYAQADVFVSPTLADYRSLAGFEAIACGLPVIASVHDGAAAEVVEDGGNGFIVDPRNTGVLAGLLAWFIDHSRERSPMGERSRLIARRYTVDRAVANLVEASCLALGCLPDGNRQAG